MDVVSGNEMVTYIALFSSMTSILFLIMWNSVTQHANHLANNSIPITEHHKQLSKYYEMGYQRGLLDASKQNEQAMEPAELVKQPTAQSVEQEEQTVSVDRGILP